MNFNSIGSSSNFARAGKASADDFVRIHAANRKNSPDMGGIVINAATRRSKEKIAATKAQSEVARVGIKAQGDVKSDRIVQEATRARDKARRKAGALATAGKMFATAGSFMDEPRKKREVGAMDGYYDKMINQQTENTKELTALLNGSQGGDSGTPEAGSNTPTGGSTNTSSGNSGSSSTSSTKPISSFQSTGKKGKFTVADMTQFALGAGFTPEQSKIMGAIGMAESGGNATIDTVQSGLDPGRTNEYSVGIFQVNAQAHGDKLRKLGYTADDLRDPQKAAQVAKMVYDEVGSFKPWSVYKSGAYSQYLQ